MQIISGITDQPAQVFNLTASDGSTVTVTLAYRPQQLGWFYNFVWNGPTPAMEVDGRRIVTSPNMVRSFKNILTWGLGCATQDNYEPLNAEDFNNGYATLLFLDPTDVNQIEQTLFPGLA